MTVGDETTWRHTARTSRVRRGSPGLWRGHGSAGVSIGASCITSQATEPSTYTGRIIHTIAALQLHISYQTVTSPMSGPSRVPTRRPSSRPHLLAASVPSQRFGAPKETGSPRGQRAQRGSLRRPFIHVRGASIAGPSLPSRHQRWGAGGRGAANGRSAVRGSSTSGVERSSQLLN